MAFEPVVATRMYARVITQSKVESSLPRTDAVMEGPDKLLHWVPASDEWPSRPEIIVSARLTDAQIALDSPCYSRR